MTLERRSAPGRSHHGDLTLGGLWQAGTLRIGDHLDAFGHSFYADCTPFTGDASTHPHVAVSGVLIRGDDTDFQHACQRLVGQ